MNIKQNMPVWVQPVELKEWPTQNIENKYLRYSLRIPQNWSKNPITSQNSFEVEHIYRGNSSGEFLLVNFMEQANPVHDLRNWVEAFISLTGLPLVFKQKLIHPPPGLLNWEYQGSCPTLTQRLECDETHLYQGLFQLADKPDLLRLYILLVRRKTLAWKISLSFLSACIPGTSAAMVAEKDHVRAGATYGYLQLF
ncbi:hypothetical protein Cylst_1271 [Cylindrospermum stagnale PCC 7417]|uniref:Uncharacterized protein n=1 Tax=Cylindrospermum stagnale PCC 7417 TaxID=56107 RepID=K9WUU5_9NOST|nr:hypothetical protein [Cylindrospermum stagnale]AFZ23564.1 hypothetical protein Cylst_1271 [Cylindrospermum stagnale PCC 7417]